MQYGRHAGQISREGYSDHVQLTPLKISILKLFLRNCETSTNREMLKWIWNAPESAGPSDAVMDTEISELRKALAPLGVIFQSTHAWLGLQDKDSAENAP